MEYLVLVSLYDDKIGYTKRSWLNLIILLLSPPLICSEGFALIRSLRSLRVLRLFRALRFIRIVIALKRGVKPISDVLVKNSLHYVTLITILLVINPLVLLLTGWNIELFQFKEFCKVSGGLLQRLLPLVMETFIQKATQGGYWQ